MTTVWPPLPGIVFLFASSTCASVYLTSFSTQDHLGDPDAARGPCSEVSSTYAKRNIFLLPRHILSQKEVAHTKLCVCVCVYTCLHARTRAHTHTCTLIVRDTCFTTKLHFLSSMALFLSLSVGTIETISRQSLVCCFCFFFLPVSLVPSPPQSLPAFLEEVSIVPPSRAWQNAWRVSWKWSFYYLRSASPPKLVRPCTKAQPSMKKTNCPHSLLCCTPTPLLALPSAPRPSEKTSFMLRNREEHSQGLPCPGGMCSRQA